MPMRLSAKWSFATLIKSVIKTSFHAIIKEEAVAQIPYIRLRSILLHFIPALQHTIRALQAEGLPIKIPDLR